jgi:hypothetical protein
MGRIAQSSNLPHVRARISIVSCGDFHRMKMAFSMLLEAFSYNLGAAAVEEQILL